MTFNYFKEISKQTGIALERIGETPTFFDQNSFEPYRYITLDGKRLEATKFNVDMEQQPFETLQERINERHKQIADLAIRTINCFGGQE